MCNVLAMNHRHLNFYNSVANPNIKNSTSSIYKLTFGIYIQRRLNFSIFIAYCLIKIQVPVNDLNHALVCKVLSPPHRCCRYRWCCLTGWPTPTPSCCISPTQPQRSGRPPAPYSDTWVSLNCNIIHIGFNSKWLWWQLLSLNIWPHGFPCPLVNLCHVHVASNRDSFLLLYPVRYPTRCFS